MIISKQSMKTTQSCAIWIHIALLFTLKLKNFFEDITDNVEKWFDTSNYSENDNRPIPIGMNKKEIGFLRMIWRKDYDSICYT